MDTKNNNPSVAHEMKRYLTHLQSHVFMAKTAYEQGNPELAQQFVKKHEETVQLLNHLIEKNVTQS